MKKKSPTFIDHKVIEMYSSMKKTSRIQYVIQTQMHKEEQKTPLNYGNVPSSVHYTDLPFLWIFRDHNLWI